MKKLAYLLGATALVATPVLADNTDSAKVTVTGAVVAALEITSTSDVEMPDLVAAGGDAPTTVTVSCDSAGVATISYGPNSSPDESDPGNGNNGNNSADCGVVQVSGEADFTYSIAATGADAAETLADDVTLIDQVCTSTEDLTNKGLIGANGTDTLYCGGTVESAGANTGSYELAMTVTVTYD